MGGINIQPPADKTNTKSLANLSSEEFLKLLEDASPEQLEALAAAVPDSNRARPVAHAAANQLVSPASNHSIVPIVGWWESRRLLYNAIVGASGLPAVIILMVCHVHLSQIFFFGVLPYAIAANMCYTLGFGAEMIARQLWKEKATHVGPMLFTLGTIFSVVLTLGLSAAVIVCGALSGLR
ncbi:MAG: hypothetical protein K2W95_30275 [Candidatus Obscuribacterales bacterium]|nr:hypothetical protein [Candidatus Obscuribacterales bacterium]